jgi:hypothetical protein
MYLDLEEDFEYERWSLLALVDARKRLSEGLSVRPRRI